jgi:hypothetical protein
MERTSPRPLSTLLQPRGWLMLGIVTAYLVLVPLAIFDAIPARSALEQAPAGSIVRKILHSLEHVPYGVRVRENMLASQHAETDIAAKVRFIALSYFIMFAAYVGTLTITGATLLLWGVRSDSFTELMSMFGRSGLSIYWVLGAIVFVVDLLVSWIGIDGLFRFPNEIAFRGVDQIITSNASIMTVVLFMGLSLLASMAILRLSLCYAYAHRHAQDVPPDLPRGSMPTMDPAPEIETWQPETRDR